MTPPIDSPKIIVWRFMDGKVGHEKQSQALIEGLQKYYSIESIDIPVTHTWIYYFIIWLFNTESDAYLNNKEPNLIIGTGHKTHLPLLAAKRYYRCKSLVIMSPTLPSQLFDAVVAPWHDYIDRCRPENVVITPTALAPKIESRPLAEQGLILLGGESHHYHWDSYQIAEQIKKIIKSHSTHILWKVSTSRRTPEETIAVIQKVCTNVANLEVLRHQDLSKEWLSLTLKTAGHIWITPDSPSMISEALMTDASVSLMNLKEKSKQAKISRANDHLISEGFLSNSINTNEKARKKISLDKTIKKIIVLLEL